MDTTTLLTPANRPSTTNGVREMFDAIAPRYDLLNTLLSGGLHRLWERRLVRELGEAKRDARCLDLCTGTGALVPGLARRFERVVGVDISPGMLQVARAKWGSLAGVSFNEGDAQALPFEGGTFDFVTVAYGVRNWPDLELGLAEVKRVLVSGGRVGILEFGQPRNRLWRGFFNAYSRHVIPFLGGLISGERAPYEYLPKTAASFPCGAEFEGILRGVGLTPLRTVSLMGGVAHLYFAENREHAATPDSIRRTRSLNGANVIGVQDTQQ
jgi:demethylmenaquinone methyltransferase/2-methoxy-6-polyprenyl-1,4-benzoquinol methylase